MTQNIYDTPDFFAAYSQLPRSTRGLDAAHEFPALQAMLPPLHGLHILDLGCGFGWFCRWARAAGAATILGLDVSENMLARAAAQTADPAITYRRADLEHPDFPAASFDLAYSSLALHYIVDLPGLLTATHRALRPGGHFVFSMEHPIYTAPSHPGWTTDATGRRTWPLNRYAIEGPRTTDWLAKGVVKQHRMIGTTLTALIRAGFTLDEVADWQPTDAQIADCPLLAEERDSPIFLLVAAHR